LMVVTGVLASGTVATVTIRSLDLPAVLVQTDGLTVVNTLIGFALLVLTTAAAATAPFAAALVASHLAPRRTGYTFAA